MPASAYKRRLPVGAEILPDGGVSFRVWAPRRKSVGVVIENESEEAPKSSSTIVKLSPQDNGYFSGFVPDAGEQTRYRFALDDEESLFPDPASRYQPDGVRGPSQVVDPSQFMWTDHGWKGVQLHGQVIYEIHIGTFTLEGTWEAAGRQLGALAETGFTLLEIMPVAEFHGRFGWGYDGVLFYAPTRLYGAPDDFRRFVDQAHALGIGVILDVVYNHFGPIGNYMKMFSLDYFTDRYETDWGEALNFDGKSSEPVRDFIVSNAMYWIEEFHLDGLRLDATPEIIDRSPEHVLSMMSRKTRLAAGKRSIILIGENEPQDVRLVRHHKDGGFELDGLWNDDFHHTAMVAATGRREAYYTDYLGSPQELISAAKWGFIYQGQYYSWQEKCRGTPTFGLKPEVFINFIQNHDQIANSGKGERLHLLTSAGRYRALTTLLFLIPGTPMIFQGQEFCSTTPFLYFADHTEELNSVVRQGRADFLKQFRSLATAEAQARLDDPADPETFRRCKLMHEERQQHPSVVALHQDLLQLRREDPVFRAQRSDWLHGAVLGPEAFLLRFFGREEGDRLLLVNLGADLRLTHVCEPLLAPPEESHWELFWSSEAVVYGGYGAVLPDTEHNLFIPGHAATVLAPKKIVRLFNE